MKLSSKKCLISITQPAMKRLPTPLLLLIFLRECAECANPIPLKDWASLYFSIENSIKNKYIF